MRTWLMAGTIVMTAFATEAHAEHYYLVEANKDDAILIDWDRLKSADTSREFWELTAFAKTKTLGGKRFDYVLTKVNLDCGSETYSYSQITMFKTDGYMVKLDKEDPSDTKPIVPESVNAGIEAIVCKPDVDESQKVLDVTPQTILQTLRKSE